MRLLFSSCCILLLGFFIPMRSAAERFLLRNPVQTRFTIRSIAFADDRVGIAVGDHGIIFRTSDRGATWQEEQSGTTSSLYSVSMPTPRHAVVVGSQGTILETSNGGAVWNRRSSGSMNELFSVSMVDSANAVIVGLTVVDVESAILVSADGGKTWKAKPSGKKRNLRDVAMVTKKIGVAVGVRGSMITTEDGGEQWNQSGTVPLCGACNRNKFVHVAMATAAVGFAAVESGEIVKTVDGGRTWRLIASIGSSISAMAFLSADTGAVAHENSVWFTYDGGATWKEKNASTNPHDEITALCWSPSLYVFVGGENGFLARSENGIFFEKKSGLTNTSLLSIAMARSGSGIVAAESGKFLRTTNRGKTWNVVSPFLEDSRIVDVALATDSAACAVTENGIILRSSDAGLHWQQAYAPVVSQLKRVALSSGGTGYCVGVKGTMLRSTDHGRTWNSIFPGTAANFLDVAIDESATQNSVVALGEGGTIFVSADEGRHWQTTETEANLTGISVSANSSWIAIGEKIFRSTDKGKQWTIVNAESPFTMSAVAMSTEGYGVIVGAKGNYSTTTNGGASWKKGVVPFADDLSDVAMAGSATWVMVGASALVVEHIQGKLDVDRDTVVLDNAGDRKIILHNTGDDDILFTSVSLASGKDVLLRSSSEPLPLEPGDSTAVRLKIKSHEPGELADELVIVSDALNSPLRIVLTDKNREGFAETLPKRVPIELPKEDYLFSVNPNPASTDITIRYTAQTAQEVHLDIIDALGRRVMMVDEGFRKEGEYVFRRDIEELTPGIYIVRLVHSFGTEMKRFIHVSR